MSINFIERQRPLGVSMIGYQALLSLVFVPATLVPYLQASHGSLFAIYPGSKLSLGVQWSLFALLEVMNLIGATSMLRGNRWGRDLGMLGWLILVPIYVLTTDGAWRWVLPFLWGPQFLLNVIVLYRKSAQTFFQSRPVHGRWSVQQLLCGVIYAVGIATLCLTYIAAITRFGWILHLSPSGSAAPLLLGSLGLIALGCVLSPRNARLRSLAIAINICSLVIATHMLMLVPTTTSVIHIVMGPQFQPYPLQWHAAVSVWGAFAFFGALLAWQSEGL